MNLSTLDWTFIFGFFAVSLGVGLYAARTSGKSSADFFLSGRNMPWWLLGISMVATTFSADTPNLVTDIVRKDGVSGNWAWWAFLLTGMLTVFVFARLWSRSKVLTDLEFYELRYSGKGAAFLRGFRAFYLGVMFNVIVMATVCLAAIKIGGAMINLTPIQSLLLASVVTVIYSAFGGLKGIIFTDFFQFVLAMIGTVWAAIVIINLPQIGGLEGLLSHPNVEGSLSFFPDIENKELFITLLLIPLAVQWWASYYPGAEPGGGGYIAQRMLAAKDEKNAMGATLLFNFAHYALRPWPWILIALASMIIFPLKLEKVNNRTGLIITQEAKDSLNKNSTTVMLEKLVEGIDFKADKTKKEEEKEAYAQLKNIVTNNPESFEIKSLAYIYSEKNFDKNSNSWKPQKAWSDPLIDEQLVYIQIANPKLPIDKLGHDLAYPTMMNFLPSGLLGLVLASLIAAFMSTISTHLNWGSSYIANDLYLRFYKSDANEKELVWVGRISTIILMILAAWAALNLKNAKQVFDIIILMGAGTGLIFILRWFWWRINAYSEISAMIISFVVALSLKMVDHGLPGYLELLVGVSITTLGWLLVTFLTPPADEKVLINFYKMIKPASKGWKPVVKKAIAEGNLDESSVEKGQLPLEILCMFIGSVTIYCALFATGYWIYGKLMMAIVCTIITIAGILFLTRIWGKLKGVKD